MKSIWGEVPPGGTGHDDGPLPWWYWVLLWVVGVLAGIGLVYVVLATVMTLA